MKVAQKTITQIRQTPVSLLTEAEIARLDPQSRAWARKCRERLQREASCLGHERIAISDRNGWHSGRCKHCGKDMSFDGGD